MLATNLQRLSYKYIAKPIIFRQDPERMHDLFILVGSILGKYRALQGLTSFLYEYKDPILSQKVHGITFSNPIGLAAGFDKNAQLTGVLPSVGFGYEEIGSITGEFCEGNPKPRLWRHPEHKSLRVNYGLKNDGCETISKRLADKSFRFPIGVSIAKTNCSDTVEEKAAIADYVKAYKAFAAIGDYDTINISCPNAFGGQPFVEPERLRELLVALTEHRNEKPMFLKLSPDIEKERLHEIAELAEKYGVEGVICGNLTKKHSFGKGGLSGKPVEKAANGHLKYLYEHFPGLTVISCGGIFTAQDVYERILQGASLVQLATGMIYEGPQVIGQINRDLARLLRRDRYESIAEAVGLELK